MRTYGRTDDNQTEMVSALRRVGAKVQSLANIGEGCPDLLVLYRGAIFLLEVKDGSKPKSKQKLTPDEIEWHEDARHRGVAVHVVNTIELALQTIGAID